MSAVILRRIPPLRGTLRIALVAVAMGVCAGAVVRSIFVNSEPGKLAGQRANGTGEIPIRTRKVVCAANII